MSEKIAMLIASYTSPVSISEILLAMSGRFCVLLRVRVVIIFHAPAARHERTISTRDWSTHSVSQCQPHYAIMPFRYDR